MPKVATAHIAKILMLEVMPDTLVRVQLRRITEQPLQMPVVAELP